MRELVGRLSAVLLLALVAPWSVAVAQDPAAGGAEGEADPLAAFPWQTEGKGKLGAEAELQVAGPYSSEVQRPRGETSDGSFASSSSSIAASSNSPSSMHPAGPNTTPRAIAARSADLRRKEIQTRSVSP